MSTFILGDGPQVLNRLGGYLYIPLDPPVIPSPFLETVSHFCSLILLNPLIRLSLNLGTTWQDHIMSLKAELESWAAALKAYDEEDFEKSLDLFSVSIVVILRWLGVFTSVSLIISASRILLKSRQTWVSSTRHSENTRLLFNVFSKPPTWIPI